MLCPNCKSENREEAKFCDQCGFALREQAVVEHESNVVSDLEPDDPSPSDSEEALEQEDSSEPEVENVCTFDTSQDDVSTPEQASEPSEPNHSPIDDSPENDDESIETDYELYQPVDSEQTDSIPRSNNVDKLVFGDEKVELPVVPKRSTDLSGFDRHSDEYEERLVTPEYKVPEPAFRDGDTIQMPRVESDEQQQSRDYLASNTAKRKKNLKIVAIAIGAVALIAAACVFGTYEMGLWGGKLIPNVVGMTEADARSILADEGFVTRTELVKSDDTEGLVLLMDPSAGNRIDEGAEIVINVATARKIPDVMGKTEEEAKTLLADEGYENIKVKKQNSDKPEGSVVDLSPKAGTRSISSTEITLTLAQPYVVPDVTNLSWDDAVEALKKAELGYDVLYISTDAYPEGSIIGTDPAAGTKVEKGTYVMIQIAQSRAESLVAIASEELAEGNTLDVGGSHFRIESLDSVSYDGDNTVSYTVTAYEFGTFLGIEVESREPETLSGTIEFNENDEIVSIS